MYKVTSEVIEQYRSEVPESSPVRCPTCKCIVFDDDGFSECPHLLAFYDGVNYAYHYVASELTEPEDGGRDVEDILRALHAPSGQYVCIWYTFTLGPDRGESLFVFRLKQSPSKATKKEGSDKPCARYAPPPTAARERFNSSVWPDTLPVVPHPSVGLRG
jgi:hypothetical protein